MTLNRVMAVILRYFRELCSFQRALRKVVEDLNFLRQKFRPNLLLLAV